MMRLLRVHARSVRSAWSLMLIAMLGFVAHGCDQSTAQDATTATQEAPTDAQNAPTTAPATTPPGGGFASSAQTLGGKLLLEMKRAYQAPEYFKDHVVKKYVMGQNLPEETFDVQYGPGFDAHIKSVNQEFWVIGDDFYMTTRTIPDRYLKLKREGDVATIMGRKRQQLVIQSEFRYGKGMNKLLESLGSSLKGKLRMTDFRYGTTQEGAACEQLTIEGDNGSTIVRVDPETKFVVEMVSRFQDDTSPVMIDVHMTFNPQPSDEPLGDIIFDPGKRTETTTIAAYRARPDIELLIAEGQPLPDFKLYTLEGKGHTQSELLGKITVLHSWATSCVSCTVVLEELKEFADRMGAGGKPLQVWPLNTLQVGMGPSERWDEAYTFWTDRKPGMPSLIDRDYSFAQSIGLNSIPATLVIDAEGKLVKALRLTQGNVADELTAIVDQIMNAADAPTQ